MSTAATNPRRRLAASWIMCAAISLLLAGCMGTTYGRSNDREQGRTGVLTKNVADKVSPNYLVALDQTWCTVATERFDNIRIGERVHCHWRADTSVDERPGRPGMPAIPGTTGRPGWPGRPGGSHITP